MTGLDTRDSTPLPPAAGLHDGEDRTAGRAGGLVRRAVVALAVVVIGGAGWNIVHQLMNPPDPYAVDLTKPLRFRDDAESNATLEDEAVRDLEFRTLRGETVSLGSFRGRKHVVLVVTRGWTGSVATGTQAGRICLFCASQTSRLIANYPELARRDAEVVVVFPMHRAEDAASGRDFTKAVRAESLQSDRRAVDVVPFPVVLDVGLGAVDRLGVRDDLAKPTTILIDKQGRVRFAYVGRSLADRPSVTAILRQLEQFEPEERAAP